MTDRRQPEAVSPHTSPPEVNSRAAHNAEHTQAYHQLHSDGHGIASRSEATGESADVSTTSSAVELACTPAAYSCIDISCTPAQSSSAYTAVQTGHKSHVDLDISAHSGSVTQLSTASDSSRFGSKQKGVLLMTDRAGDAMTGIGSRCTTATQPSETEHSRGLQQIWNSMARTPLAVPSPRAVASSLSQLSVASSTADLPDQQSGYAAEPFSLPRTGRGTRPSVSSSTSTGVAAGRDTASEQHQVPSENDVNGTDAEIPVR